MAENVELTEKIIGCAYIVANTLGHGFLEKVYEKALLIELRRAGLEAEARCPIAVKYDGDVIGEFFADILVENSGFIELKACKGFEDIHIAQVLNYLKATGLKTGLLLNFGTPKVQIKRVSL